MINRKVTFLLLVLLCAFHAKSQSMKGHVVDENGQPLYSAAIILLNPDDSSFVNAVLTDTLGFYDIAMENRKSGIIKITSFGYEDYFIDYSPQNSLAKNHEVVLKIKSFLLDEVLVKGSAPVLQRKADHFSFSLANTELVKGNNMWNVLKLTPFLQVDDFSGIKMIGREGVTVYINGRKTRFSGNSIKSYLESLPAEEIVNIEIMTNPTSSFRAEDSSGAINIILRKNELEGTRGNISFTDLQSDYKNYWNGSAFLNYRKNKVDLTSTVFVNRNKNRQTNTNHYNYLEENSYTLAKNRINRDGINSGLQLNMDYRPNANQVIGIMANASVGNNKAKGLNYNYYQPLNQSQTDSISKTDQNNKSDVYQINANINYYLKLNDKGDFISIDADFLSYQNKYKRKMNIDLLDPGEVFLRTLDQWDQRQVQKITNGSAKIDYQLNFNEQARMKVGGEVYTTRSDADELWDRSEVLNEYSGQLQDNQFIYDETISAGYASFSKEWKKMSAMIGLRVEYTSGKGDVEEDPVKNFSRHHLNVFPSATLNFTPNQNNNLSLSVSSGIRRPEFTQLNPFRVYTSETSYRENNPFLKNMKTYNLNFTYTLKSKYILQFNQFIAKNSWSLFRIPVEGTSITRELFDNYGDSNMSRLNLMWNESLFDGLWYVNYSAGGYYAHSKGTIESTVIDVSGYVPNLYLSNSFRLSKSLGIKAMLMYYFLGKEKIASVEHEPMHNLNFRIQKEFKSLSLSLGVNDILNYKIKESYKTDHYSYKSTMQFNSRNIWISATYNWGNQKVKGARNRRTNTDINRRIN